MGAWDQAAIDVLIACPSWTCFINLSVTVVVFVVTLTLFTLYIGLCGIACLLGAWVDAFGEHLVLATAPQTVTSTDLYSVFTGSSVAFGEPTCEAWFLFSRGVTEGTLFVVIDEAVTIVVYAVTLFCAW